MDEANSYYTEIPLYRLPLTIVMSDSMAKNTKELEDTFKTLNFDNAKNTLGYSCTVRKESGRKHFVIAITVLEDMEHEDVQSVIAHESLHLSWRMCEYLGIKLNPENNEAQAYLIGYIVKKVNEKLKMAFDFNISE